MANRVLLGQDGSDFVLKVSKEGDNVLSPAQPLLFDSNQSNYFNVIKGGQITFSVSYSLISSTFFSFTGVWINVYDSNSTQSSSSISYGETQNYLPFISFFQVSGTSTKRYAEYGQTLVGQVDSSGGANATIRPFYTEITSSSFVIKAAPHRIITSTSSQQTTGTTVSRDFAYMVLGVEP